MRLGRTDEAWTAFERRFRERWGTAPDYFAAYAYDGARLTIDAIRQAGPNRIRIHDALYALATYDGVSGRMRFDPTLNNLAPLHVYRVSGGAFVPLERQVASR
jgi:branched-chain amino acid transport system substrate-binding protein